MKSVFVNSLPKSGTNLLAKCLLLFGYQEKGHISTGTILDNDLRSRLRRLLWSTTGEGYSIGVNSPCEVRRWPIDIKLDSLKADQFITAHVGYNERLLQNVVKRGIEPVQMLRDPRAVLASFVPYVLNDPNHFMHNAFMIMSTEQRYRAALLGTEEHGLSIKPMKEYCQALSVWIKHPRVFTLQFESLVGEKGGGSRQIMLDVLQRLSNQLTLPQDKIGQVADQLYGPGRHTFRKGQINAWREELPAEILTRANEELAPILKLWEYPCQ